MFQHMDPLSGDRPAPTTSRFRCCQSTSLPDRVWRTQRSRRRRRNAPTLLAASTCAVVAHCLASSWFGPPAAGAAWGFVPGRAASTSSSSPPQPHWRRERVALRKKDYIKTGGGKAPTSPGDDATSSYVAPILTDDDAAAAGKRKGADRSAAASGAAAAASRSSSTTLLDVLRPRSDRDANQIGPTQLAFVGDVVYEMFVRCRYLWPARRHSDLQSTVIGVVRAEAQSVLLGTMTESFPLTEKERSILTRGRNAGTGTRGRKKGPKRLDDGGGASTYQDSTALEALIGYTYMEDADRCFGMLDWVRTELDRVDAAAAAAGGGIPTGGGSPPPSASSLLDLLRPRSDRDVDQISPIQLAYLGDSVYELMARNRYVWPHRRTADLHNKVVSVSRAETQSHICRALKVEESCTLRLTDREKSILTRGRNAGSGSHGRQHGPKKRLIASGGVGGGVAMYQDAAALEALLGYTYINDADRCLEMLEWVRSELDVMDSEPPT